MDKKTLKDGDKLGIKCSKCSTELEFEMGFEDRFCYKSGHYTVEKACVVCPKCDEIIGDYEDFFGGEDI